MNGMEDFEEGEVSDGDAIEGYTPLARPELPRPTVSPWGKSASRLAAKPLPLSDDSDDASAASSDDSDSEDEKPARKRRGGVVDPDGAWGRHARPIQADGGGQDFRKMAEAFQADRAARGLPTRDIKKNNVWGSLIQEESLTEELGGVGVGKSLKDLHSDRGAETYDYTLHQADKKAEREAEMKERSMAQTTNLDDEMDSYWARSGSPEEEGSDDGRDDNGYTEVRSKQRRGSSANHLDEEMDGYWSRRGSKDETEEVKDGCEDKRGKKRNVRDRLGKRPPSRPDTPILGEGVPHEIDDLELKVVTEGTDEELGSMIAARLQEPKEQIIHGIIETIGRDAAMMIFSKTQLVEAEGGMMIKNGARRRTCGGTFLQLVRESEDPSIDQEKVKSFFNYQHNQERKMLIAHKKKKKKNFEQEMDAFLKAKKKMTKKNKDTEMDVIEDSKEDTMEKDISDEEDDLPVNIFSLLTGSMPNSTTKIEKHEDLEDVVEPELQKFVEPEAPPNSVERLEQRVLNAYDDDFLGTTDDSEAIELF